MKQAMKARDIRFTLADDAHGPNDVGMFFGDKLGAYLDATGVSTDLIMGLPPVRKSGARLGGTAGAEREPW